MWARVAPLLERALVYAHGTHELVDVMQACGEGRLQLWVGRESAAVSEILTFPRKRSLNVFLAAGKWTELLECLPGMEAFARAHACDQLMFSGRLDAVDGRASGWERLMPGFTPTHIALSKELA